MLNVVVYYEGKILIVKRSQKVGTYRGLWNGISGFIDEPKSIEEFAKQELMEEVAFDERVIASMGVCRPYEVDDQGIGRTWVVYPVLVMLRQKPAITLDWEHTDFAWINPEALKGYEYVKDFDVSVREALARMSE